MKRYVLGLSGASGSIFGIRLLQYLVRSAEVHFIVSVQSFSIIRHETGIDWEGASEGEVQEKIRIYLSSDRVYYYHDNNLAAPPSSGSFKNDGMLIVPCSMKTLAGIAGGHASNLVERAADVAIKEGRKLLLSPREMPLSAIHLENMLKLSRLGVTIAPPIPAFYHKPKDLDDIIDFVTAKILDSFNLEHDLFRRWGT
ncbi:MAG TPA: flavin prenyltransferase UbiX [Thermodesulfovibrionales bacterium]|nr:flavin prenyltransferase UbiX [Thermodesulfovibrionales bacterium]